MSESSLLKEIINIVLKKFPKIQSKSKKELKDIAEGDLSSNQSDTSRSASPASPSSLERYNSNVFRSGSKLFVSSDEEDSDESDGEAGRDTEDSTFTPFVDGSTSQHNTNNINSPSINYNKTNQPQFSRSSVGGSKYLLNVHPNEGGEDDLMFESRFESGNLAKAIKITPSYYELYLRPDMYTNRHTQWFYFRVLNTRKGVTYRFVPYFILESIKTTSNLRYFFTVFL